MARFQRDGFVEIEDAVPSGLVARIRRVFMDAMETKVTRFALAPVVPTDGRDRGNSNLKIDFRPDQRLVHRGTANTGTSPRPCLSIWYKDLKGFSITGTTIPVPHRGVADRMAKLALWMRREGRGTGGAVRNRTLLNLGNYFCRIVEETSASDRDHRRRIPRKMWDSLSPEMRSLLRYASVDGVPEEPRSVLGSAILAAAGVAFAARAWQLEVTSRSAGRR